jgi:imidazolonepropionase-like amidohydrolase
MKHLMKNGRILDGRGKTVENGWLLIDGQRIAEMGPPPRMPKEPISSCTVTDLAGKTVMPGLIDGHVHICFDASADAGKGAAGRSDSAQAFLAARNAAQTLAAGVTTVRDLGGKNFINLFLRDAIRSGQIPGPRVLSAGHNICMTGGHGWQFGREADGPDEVRRAVREQMRAGADLIKFMCTGGTLTQTGEPGQTQFTEEELRAGIEEAHKAGLKTATHAKGIEGTKYAVAAGIDTVEHGAMLDDELIEWILKRGVFVVPTLTAGAHIIEKGTAAGIPEWAVEKARRFRPMRLESLSKAKKAGVKIAFGTDAGTPFNPHGKNASELVHIQEIGLTPEEALIAAASVNAGMLGLEDRIGTLAPGFIADLLIVDGDPLADVKVLTDPGKLHAVFQGGRKVAEEGKLIW